MSSEAYTHFGRTYPSDQTAAEFLASELAGFGWTYIGVLHVRDAWASAYAAHLAQACQRRGGLRVHTTATWNEGSVEEVSSAVALMRESGVNIIVFLCSKQNPVNKRK